MQRSRSTPIQPPIPDARIVATSVAPLFGDWKDPAGDWPKKFRVPPAASHPGIGLLAIPEWVFAIFAEP